jgi:hypothetical protein
MTRYLFSLLLLLVAHTSLAAGPSKDPRELLRESIDLYVVGKYGEAVKILRPLVDGRVLKDPADQREALRTYGISLYLDGKRPGAERAFRDLLRLDPRARLDPSFVRPEVVTFFEEVRKRYQLEIREVERRGSRSVAPNLLPPWGQFRNGHRLKGYLLLSGELTFGVTSITTAALLWSWKDETGQFGDKEDLYRPVSVLNYVTFGVTVALLVYGVVDGLYYHYTSPPPSDARRAGAENPKRQPRLGMWLF